MNISVVTPAYNHADYLESTITKCVSSNRPIAEIIVIDDGPKLNYYLSSQLLIIIEVIFIEQKNMGNGFVRNQDTKLPKGDRITY